MKVMISQPMNGVPDSEVRKLDSKKGIGNEVSKN